MTEKITDNENSFWEKIYIATGIVIKPSIKNILQFMSFDNALSFASITHDDIETMEKFAREEMGNYLDADSDPKDYYGIHFKNPSNFKFMQGERVLLQKLIEVVKNKEIEFWAPNPTRSITKTTESLVKETTVNFNIEDEKNKLKRSISCTITNFRKKARFMDEEMKQILNGTTDINMSAAYKDESQQSVEYTSIIQCPFCVNKISLKKTNVVNKITNWKCSNFLRHLKTHSKPEENDFSATIREHNEVNNHIFLSIIYFLNVDIKLKRRLYI